VAENDINSSSDNPGAGRVGPAFGMAITTVGRWDQICQLLDDLAGQTFPPRMVAIAYDSGDKDAANGLRKVERYAEKLTIRTAVKHGGSTAGHNTAVSLFTDDVDWIYLLTDNCRLEYDLLERLAPHCAPPATVCAWRLVDADGDRNRLPPVGSSFTRHNAWSVVVPAMAIRHDAYKTVGGFDTTIGSGSDSPWQSGDETDLLLKLSLLDDFSIRWVPDIAVQGHTDFTHLTPAERRRKLRGYGRGMGYVYRRWDYSAWAKLRILVGAASLPLRKPKKFRARDGFALLVGRSEGILGRKFARDSDHRAVLR
jgi:hypothetical protein